MKGQGADNAQTQRLLPQKPPGTARAAFSFRSGERIRLPAGRKTPSFSEEKEAKDFWKEQGADKAQSQQLLLQKPGGTDGRLFPFARERVRLPAVRKTADTGEKRENVRRPRLTKRPSLCYNNGAPFSFCLRFFQPFLRMGRYPVQNGRKSK